MTQNILTCFKFITIINIINYVIIKNTFIINYLLICTLIGIFYIVIDSNKNKLNNISDIKLVENSSKVGFSLEFNDREDGGIGLKNLYHLNLNVKTMEIALKYQAISNGDVNIIDVFSTDSKIITNKLKLLNDDRHLFPPYQGAPLLREETLKKHPELEKILNKLAGKITEKEMTEMNYKVDIEGKPAYDVAKEYLQKEGLIKK